MGNAVVFNPRRFIIPASVLIKTDPGSVQTKNERR
jgi:hypothetical protein